MSQTRPPWGSIVSKVLVNGVLVAPTIGTLLLVICAIPFEKEIGRISTPLFVLAIMLGAALTTAPYTLLASSILAWRTFVWSAEGLGERRILVRAAVLSSVLGAIWGAFLGLTTREGQTARHGLFPSVTVNPAFVLASLLGGAIAGVLLCHWLRRDRQGIRRHNP